MHCWIRILLATATLVLLMTAAAARFGPGLLRDHPRPGRERIFLAATEITAMPAAAGSSRSRVEFGMAVK